MEANLMLIVFVVAALGGIMGSLIGGMFNRAESTREMMKELCR